MTKKKIFATILLPLVVAGSGLTLFAETAKAGSTNLQITPYYNGGGMRYYIQY